MSKELTAETDKHENVKERLNSLLHKKIHDQNEKMTENANKIISASEEKNTQGELSNEATLEISENCEDDLGNNSDDESLLSQHVLHYILNEKKKELLRNKEVIQFLQNKLKYP